MIWRVLRFVAPAIVVAMAATPSSAQLNRYETMEMASVMLTGSQSVQKELKFSATQTNAVQQAFSQYAETAQKLVAAYRKDRAHKEKYNNPLKAAQRKLISTCLTALSNQQIIRLRQIGIQHYGIMSVTQPDIAKQLKMTPAQLAQAKKYYLTYFTTMDTVSKARAAQIRAVPQPKNVNNKAAVDAYKAKVSKMAKEGRDIDVKKILGVQKDMEAKTKALLSKSQLQAFEAMKGKPFKES